VAAAVPDGHRVLFKAIDPVALGATGSPGNLIRAHSHLSSSAVTGMLVRWALESGCSALADALLDRRIACGPAYPLPPHAFKTLTEKLDAVPFPLSFQSPKPAGQAGAQPWWAADPVPDAWVDTLEEERKPEGERQGEKLKRPGAHDYLVRIGEQWQRFRCEPGEAMRNNAGTSQRAGIKQDLFSQEEVPEDTGFLSRIVAADADAEALLQPALVALATGGHWLQAGRGGAPMAVHAHSRADAGDSSAADGNGPQPTRVRLYVESDLILRADDLRFRTRLDRDAVLHLLTLAGADPALLTRVRDSVDVLEVSEPVEVRGRNVATAGPRLPALAIRRGSEADLRFKDAVDAQACRMVLQGLAPRGAGERALEGHGRLRVDFVPVQGTDEMTKDGELGDIRVHEDEALLEAAALWLKRKGFPRGFSPKRWQDLRNAARANGPELFRAWLVQAAREADRLAQRSGGGSGGDDGTVGWLNALRELVVKDLNTYRPLLRTLGLLAAKKAVAASKRDKRARVEEVAATNPGEGGAA